MARSALVELRQPAEFLEAALSEVGSQLGGHEAAEDHDTKDEHGLGHLLLFLPIPAPKVDAALQHVQALEAESVP